MDSNSLNPYKVKENNLLDYSFANKDGIIYHAYFMPVYQNYPDLVNTYSFSIEPEDPRPHPIDRRIAETIVYILCRFFENVDNAMIMICDNTDGKQRKRRNLFSRWFHIYNDGTIASLNAEAGQGDYELLLSIYFKKDNSFKQQLIKAFGELLTRDLYEIII